MRPGVSTPLRETTAARRRLRATQKVLLSLYLFIYVFAVPMLIFDLVPVWGVWMGAFLNVLQGCLLGAWLIANAGGRGLIAALGIAVLAFIVEYVGVTTGAPFGRYVYNDPLGFKLLGAVPLPIPFAWLLVVPAAIGTARLISKHWTLAIAPLLVLLFDLLLEPFAVYVLGYWTWLERGPYYGIPAANFVAWWLTGAVLVALTLLLCGRRVTEAHTFAWLPALLYLLNIVQFTLVDLVNGYRLAALLGLVLLAIAGWRARVEIAARKSGWLVAGRNGRRAKFRAEAE